MIQWREALAVGHPNIDSDHQRLLNLINLFETADEANIEQTLFELVQYTRAHFAREEAFQRQMNFPEAAKHKVFHDDLAKESEKLLHLWETTPRAGQAALILRIAPFLRGWLIDHIINEDLKMKPYLAAPSSGAGVRPAR